MEDIAAFTAKKSYLLLLEIVVGWLVGAGIILYQYDATEQSLQYYETPSFSVWLMLMGLLMGLLPVFAIPLWLSLARYKTYWQEGQQNIILSSLLLLALVMAPIPFVLLFTKITFPLYLHIPKMIVIFFLTFLSVLPAAIGLWLTNVAALDAYQQIDPTLVDVYPYIKKANYFNRNLQLYLAIAGVLISLVVLSTITMRDALIQYDPAIEEAFSIQMVLAYGLYFTFVLALIYVPTFSTLQENGRKLRDQLYPLNSLADYDEKAEARQKFEEMLGLRIGLVQNLRSSVFILGPLLTSFISSMFNF